MIPCHDTRLARSILKKADCMPEKAERFLFSLGNQRPELHGLRTRKAGDISANLCLFSIEKDLSPFSVIGKVCPTVQAAFGKIIGAYRIEIGRRQFSYLAAMIRLSPDCPIQE